MEKTYITAEEVEQAFAMFREQNASDPAKLKFIDASYRWLSRESDVAKRQAGVEDTIKILQEWEKAPVNPLLNEQIYITGFARLLENIRSEYPDLNLTDGEVLLLSNRLVDIWMENYLDKSAIDELITDIRTNPNQDEFGLELRGGIKK